MHYQPLDEDLFGEKRIRAWLNYGLNDNKDTFRIEKPDKSSIDDILKIRSMLPFLYAQSERLKNTEEKLLDFEETE